MTYEIAAIDGQKFKTDAQELAALRAWGLKVPEKVTMVASVDDVFILHLQLEGFAERSVRQLVDAIQTSKRVELQRFLYGLGIPEVGAAVARDLAEHFRNLDVIRHADR